MKWIAQTVKASKYGVATEYLYLKKRLWYFSLFTVNWFTQYLFLLKIKSDGD